MTICHIYVYDMFMSLFAKKLLGLDIIIKVYIVMILRIMSKRRASEMKKGTRT